jgi:hypothetical protein
MKEQVTSIEQSKLLIELSVPAEMASMVWFPEYKIGDNKLPIYPTGNYELVMKYKSFGDMEDKVIPAFTIADLIDMLPITCGDLHINIEEITNIHKYIYYEGREYIHGKGYADLQTVLFVENSFVESCVKAIEWVISNNYKLNI